MNIVKQRALAHRITHAIQREQLLGLPPGGGEIDFRARAARAGVHLRQFADHFLRFIDARLRFRGPRLRPPPQPIDFGMHAILQRLLTVSLRVEIFFLSLEECAVVSGNAQRSILISGVEFDNLVRHVFQKISVVADDHASERRILQHSFQPLDASEVEVVGRFVEQQNIRRLHQRLDNRQPLAPATGQRRRLGVQIGKTGASQNFCNARKPFGVGDLRAIQRFVDDRSNRFPAPEFRDLQHAADSRAFADRYFPAVRTYQSVQNREKGRFAGTVRPDDADAVAFRYREGDIFKKWSDPVSFG